MANTQFKQATIAYKVSALDGAPLDINGDKVSVSGLKQAVALLIGTTNPNPTAYVVEFYFEEGAVVYGSPTLTFDPVGCPLKYIIATPKIIYLTDAAPVAHIYVNSTDAWSYTSGTLASSTVVTVGGTTANDHAVEVTRVSDGDGLITFTNNVTGQTDTVQVISVSALEWILEDGIWNLRGLWLDGGIWKTI